MKLVEKEITVRTVSEADLRPLWEVAYGPQANLEWKQWDGPYFNDPILDWEAFRTGWGAHILDNPHSGVICYQDKIVGQINGYFEDGDLKRWLEFGLVIYDPQKWNGGIGTTASRLFIGYLFDLHPELPHIGYTTWSGNLRMMKLGEKLGMQKEAQIRQVRFWQGQYYDSVKYGILRDEFCNK